jgi:hypothetical protein
MSLVRPEARRDLIRIIVEYILASRRDDEEEQDRLEDLFFERLLTEVLSQL